MKPQAILLALLCAWWPATSHAQKEMPQKTIENLNAAVQGEANAAHRYTLFAEKADREDYGQVARLFRAAALAESIHQKNFERALRELGAEPKEPKLEDVKIGTTAQNLQVPIQGEANEADKMYPMFVKQAERDNIPAAAKAFTYALNTEAEHEKLFKDALDRLGQNPPTKYYVGKISGDTVTKPTDREPYTKVE